MGAPGGSQGLIQMIHRHQGTDHIDESPGLAHRVGDAPGKRFSVLRLTELDLQRRQVGGPAGGGLQACGGTAVVDRGAGPIVVTWLPRPSKAGSKIVTSGQFRGLSGDHCEGQFEGQNCASECLSEPVSACVS